MSYGGDNIGEPISLSESDHFNLRKYCLENSNFHLNNGKIDPTEALLLSGESSPFFFTRSTVYGPFLEMKNFLNGARVFDFSIRKWKMVAWSTLQNDSLSIQNVLFIGKKTKSLWLLVNVPNRTVLVFTKWGFYLDIDSDRIHSTDFLSLL